MDLSLRQGPADKKRKAVAVASTAIVPISSGPSKGEASTQNVTNTADAELLFREQLRVTLEVNPLYLRRLKDRKELGYQRPVDKKKLTIKVIEIDVTELRRCFTQAIYNSLFMRYHMHVTRRASEIESESSEISLLTAEICMAAVYAKLRNLHKSYGKHGSRYTSTPSYSKDVELPLPFALAIQDLGAFETHSMLTNFVYLPTYPEGISNEGRERTDYCLTEYQSYLPTLKELGFPVKTVDARVKAGTAWWTYKVENNHNTVDLVCTLPPSHYSDLSAVIRSSLLVPAADNNCKDIVKHPADVEDYGTRLREMQPNSYVRSFVALSHGSEEEWSFGSS